MSDKSVSLFLDFGHEVRGCLLACLADLLFVSQISECKHAWECWFLLQVNAHEKEERKRKRERKERELKHYFELPGSLLY